MLGVLQEFFQLQGSRPYRASSACLSPAQQASDVSWPQQTGLACTSKQVGGLPCQQVLTESHPRDATLVYGHMEMRVFKRNPRRVFLDNSISCGGQLFLHRCLKAECCLALVCTRPSPLYLTKAESRFAWAHAQPQRAAHTNLSSTLWRGTSLV